MDGQSGPTGIKMSKKCRITFVRHFAPWKMEGQSGPTEINVEKNVGLHVSTFRPLANGWTIGSDLGFYIESRGKTHDFR